MSESLNDMFSTVTGCCLHDPQWLPGDVDRELSWKEDKGHYAESSTIIIVRLNAVNGQQDYGLLTESADTTGHGCRCDSMTVREPSLSRLLSHLSDRELEWVIGNDQGYRYS